VTGNYWDYVVSVIASLGINPSNYSTGNKLNVMFFGDSITQGTASDSSVLYGGFRGFLQEGFNSIGFDYRSYRITGAYDVSNGPNLPYANQTRSVGLQGAGFTGSFGAGNLRSAFNAVSGYAPDLIYLMGGVNDVSLGYTIPTILGQANNLVNDMFIYFPGVTIVLGSVPMFPSGSPYNTGVNALNHALYTGLYQTNYNLGKKIFWVDLNSLMSGRITEGSGIKLYSPDNVHPMKDGYKTIANAYLRSNVFTQTNYAPGITVNTGINFYSGVDNYKLLTATGTIPYDWYIISGSVPSNVEFNGPFGFLSGNILNTGNYLFNVRLSGFNQSDTKLFNLNIGQRSLNDGLIELWDFNEGIGLRTGLNGTVLAQNGTVGTGFGVGPSGISAGTFSNSNYLKITGDSRFNINTGDFTLGLWTRFTKFEFREEYLITNPNGWRLRFNGGPGGTMQFVMIVNSGSPQISTSINYPNDTGSFHLLVANHNVEQKRINLSLDNLAATGFITYTGTPFFDNNLIKVGAEQFLPTDAYYDQLFIFNRLLSSGEKTRLYNGGVPLAYSGYSGIF
jgi:lysophospholipase L1-like esterase